MSLREKELDLVRLVELLRQITNNCLLSSYLLETDRGKTCKPNQTVCQEWIPGEHHGISLLLQQRRFYCKGNKRFIRRSLVTRAISVLWQAVSPDSRLQTVHSSGLDLHKDAKARLKLRLFPRRRCLTFQTAEQVVEDRLNDFMRAVQNLCKRKKWDFMNYSV